MLQKEPTVKDRILNFFKGATTDYIGDEKLTGAAKKLFKQYKKLFDEFSAMNYQTNAFETATPNADEILEQSSQSVAYALANNDKNDYNSQKGAVNNEKQGTKTTETSQNQENSRRDEGLHGSRWRVVSVFNDNGTTRQLSEIIKSKKTIEQVSEYYTEIYTKPHTETQENLSWHAKNEDINIYFAKTKQFAANVYFYDGKNLFINENASVKTLVEILNDVKPAKRLVSSDKIAHISAEMWGKFLAEYPQAY